MNFFIIIFFTVDDIRKLNNLYREKNYDKNGKGGTAFRKGRVQSDPRLMMVYQHVLDVQLPIVFGSTYIILGGMIYDSQCSRGVKKKCYLNPILQKLSNSSLQDIYEKAKQLYFTPETNLADLKLGDSSGMVIVEQKWVLEKYYEEFHYQPSRHKLYVIYYERVNKMITLFMCFNNHY